MAIPVVASTATSLATTTSPLAVTKPSGMASGDIWVALVGSTGSGNTVSMPAGWNERISAISISGADNLRLTLFDRKCDGSEGASVNATGALGSGPYLWAHSARLTGCDQTTWFDTATETENSGYILGRDLPSIGTGGADRLLIACLSRWYTASLDTQPSEWTNIVSNVDLMDTWSRSAASAATYDTASFDDAGDWELWSAVVGAYIGASSAPARRNIPAWRRAMGLG